MFHPEKSLQKQNQEDKDLCKATEVFNKYLADKFVDDAKNYRDYKKENDSSHDKEPIDDMGMRLKDSDLDLGPVVDTGGY